jgi:hypothetical protein
MTPTPTDGATWQLVELPLLPMPTVVSRNDDWGLTKLIGSDIDDHRLRFDPSVRLPASIFAHEI